MVDFILYIPRCLVPKRTSSFPKSTVKSRAVYFGIVLKLLEVKYNVYQKFGKTAFVKL